MQDMKQYIKLLTDFYGFIEKYRGFLKRGWEIQIIFKAKISPSRISDHIPSQVFQVIHRIQKLG